MNKIHTLLRRLLFIAMVPLIAASCNKDLQDDVTDLKDRVTTLEESVDKLQQAIESGKLITDVSPFEATSTTPSGWKITFSDNKTLDVYNGVKGDQGQTGAAGPQGPTGETGPQGQTPYIWVNSAGNWATNMGSKPADPDNASYELKVDGQSVKAYGTSTRTKNIDGFIGFEEYDAVSGVVKNTVKTTIPYDHENYITSIVETDESVTMTIDGESYTLAKAAVYPSSITVIRDRDYVIKGGTVSFNIAVNPSTSKIYTKDDFALDYEKNYTKTRGVDPDFIKIKDVKASTTNKGQYTMLLEWAESDTQFAKDAAIFIVLNFTDVKGNPAKAVSATPVIMNEKYVSIDDYHVEDMDDVYMFTDETYTDSVRLNHYHEGYVNTVNYVKYYPYDDENEPVCVNPMTRYLGDGNKYKFTIVPIGPSNATVWSKDIYERHSHVDIEVTDWGRAAVPQIPARPEIGQPAIPGIPAIDPTTIERYLCITVYKHPADGVIYKHDFKDRWIPNKTVNYNLTVALGDEFEKNGYYLDEWSFAIESQTLKKGSAVIAMTDNITPDVTKFDGDNDFTISYALSPKINTGAYSIEFVVTATSEYTRPAELKQEREFKVVMTFNIVAPSFEISIKNPLHTIIGNASDTYYTYKLANVNVADLLDVESTRNVSLNTDLTPNAAPLGYEFDMTEPRHGAQGVRFNPYPAVAAPAIADWGSLTFIRKPITVVVKLDTGQEIPVHIMCQDSPTAEHALGKIYVQYDRLNLNIVSAAKTSFYGNYNSMILSGISTAAGDNFTPKASNGKTLDPTMIKSTDGIVYSEIGTVQCQGGSLPSGLAGKKILSIDAATGVVKSVDGMTWENPDAVLYQVFRVTYTDIWGNSASKDVAVYVKSNSIPTVI